MASMPEQTQYLDTFQLRYFRERLENERRRLRNKLVEAMHADGKDVPQDPLLNDPEDFAEMAQDITYEETELALSANDLHLLEQVERALLRMDEGTYGISEVTGKPIPYERLDALPWATTNVDDAIRR
jgi:DnaK suppressor protein